MGHCQMDAPEKEVAVGLGLDIKVEFGKEALSELQDTNMRVYYFTCFFCGCGNHTQRDCPIKRCEKCKSFKHTSKTCRFCVKKWEIVRT